MGQDQVFAENSSPLLKTYEIVCEGNQNLPVVLASPHSGNDYPLDFIQQTKLSKHSLRQSEDGHVDQIMIPLTQFGVPLIRALFPRVFVDLNREAFELDPDMFDTPLPGYVNTKSYRASAGIGTIARITGCGNQIYDAPLSFDQIHQRIHTYYYPYHAALRRLVDDTRAQFGHCLLLDCHSMPASSCQHVEGNGPRIDFVLGDCHRTSCDHRITNRVEQFLTRAGFRVSRNRPFAGGYTTRHYGTPRHHVHALQIEINRALYMDEETYAPLPALNDISRLMIDLVHMLADHHPALRAAE